jgi:hypothetical protein
MMCTYPEEYCDRPKRAQRDDAALPVPVQATPEANQVLSRFAEVVENRGR